MKAEKKNIFDWISEVIGWISIALSPLLLSILLGFMIYSFKPGSTSFVIGILLTCMGLITGILWATNIWKKYGTIQFLSKLISTDRLKNKTGSDETHHDQPVT